MSVKFTDFATDFERLREERLARLSPEKQEWFRAGRGAGLRELGVEGMIARGKALAGTPVIAAGVTTTDLMVDGPHGPVPVRIYRPAGAVPFGVHVHIHAGGYIMLGGLDTEATKLSNMALDVGCIVVAPDFRLPPEHKFPTGIEDCWAVLQWVAGYIGEHGGDPARIGVGGGCTGGALSAVLALMARDAGLPLRYLYMASTVTDVREEYYSYYECANGYTLTQDSANFVTSVYLRDDRDRFDWRASPVLAPSVRGLPKTLVVEGEWDVLHDEAKAWADRLRDAGVDVEFSDYAEEGHSFSPEAAMQSQSQFHAFVKAGLAA